MNDNTRDINFLYDVELEMAVVLCTSRMLIKDLLQLQSGSVVELGKLAGESLDVVINDKVVARGGGRCQREVWDTPDRSRFPLRACQHLRG